MYDILILMMEAKEYGRGKGNRRDAAFKAPDHPAKRKVSIICQVGIEPNDMLELALKGSTQVAMPKKVIVLEALENR